MPRRTFLTAVVLLLSIIGLAPICVMFYRSVIIQGRFSLALYRSLLDSGRQWTLLGNSLAVAAVTAVLSAAVGVPLGVLFGRTDLPLRRTLAVLFSVPFLIPPYIVAVAWADSLAPSGILSRLIGPSAAHAAAGLLFSLPGCVAILFSTLLPVVMLLTMAYLRTVNPRLEEAGRLSTGPGGVLRRITLPLIWPGILLATTLVFLLALGEFGVPTYLRVAVYPAESFAQFSAFFDFGTATIAAIPLALMAVVVLGIEWLILPERTHQLRPAAADGMDLPHVRLAGWRYPLAAAVALLSLLVVVMPLGALLARSASSSAYREAWLHAGESLVRSMAYAAVGASALSLVGFFIGYIVQNKALPGWRLVDWFIVLLFALPGTVIATGMIALWNHPMTNLIYATPAIIVVGYVAQYTALTGRITTSVLSQIPPSMEEAAQVAGGRWFRRIGLIVAPMARRGLAAGWLVGYIFCLRDTGITMMLYPPGSDTLPVRIFTLMANGSAEMIAAACVLMILATLVPLWLVGLVLHMRGFRPWQ
jgi:iron(III) transport system permease protein